MGWRGIVGDIGSQNNRGLNQEYGHEKINNPDPLCFSQKRVSMRDRAPKPKIKLKTQKTK